MNLVRLDTICCGRGCPAETPAGRGRSRRPVARAGFSLVEVLFAVLILGIALLGIGAMFPAVIREQRLANDSTFGVLVARGAEDYLRGHARLSRDFWEYWATLGQATRTNASDDARNLLPTGSWSPLTIAAGSGAAVLGELNVATSPPDDFRVIIPLSDRLYPTSPGGGSSASVRDTAGPGFVWDLAVRRLAALPAPVPAEQDLPITRSMNTVQVAVFVRRVDSGLRPDRGVSPYAAMLDTTLPASSRRLPVSEDARGPRLDGAYDGARYSAPMVLQASFDAGAPGAPPVRDRLRLGGAMLGSDISDAQLRSLASSANQVLVDDFGNVYTVIGIDTRINPVNGASTVVRISPPVPASVSPGDITQVLFTLQPPAAVRVFTVNP
jgi:prepilin-type N-terminal cleavage/methylation domain-containing protein